MRYFAAVSAILFLATFGYAQDINDINDVLEKATKDAVKKVAP